MLYIIYMMGICAKDCIYNNVNVCNHVWTLDTHNMTQFVILSIGVLTQSNGVHLFIRSTLVVSILNIFFGLLTNYIFTFN